jgi:hypothetical protein
MSAVPVHDLTPAEASLSVETRLLVSCARTDLDPSTRALAEELLSGEIDWASFIELARMHQVRPLVASTLVRSLPSFCPPSVIEQLRSAARANAVRSLAAEKQLVGVLQLFRSADVPIIAYKGPLLSAIAYGGHPLREFTDLDVWVHPWDFHLRVESLLAAKGWSRVADFGFERSFKGPNQDVVLDVHQSLTSLRHMPFALDFEKALDRSESVEMAGIKVRTLAVSDLLIVLCMQIAKDTAEPGGGPPLIKVCDLAELMRSHADLDWASILSESRRLGVLNVVCLGIAVAARLLGSVVPDPVAAASQVVPDLDSLVRHVEERVLGGSEHRYTRPELLARHSWNAAIRERFRDRHTGVIALAHFTLSPNEDDYAFVRLPKKLASLYVLVRPARLAWKYTRVGIDRMFGSAHVP